ncbi:uncharacterized protein LOC111109460 [Crassostrea virginica]
MMCSSGMVIKTCSYCPLPQHLYCKTCHSGLCSDCLADHLENATGGAHYVCRYRDLLAAESIRKHCRKHEAYTCEDFCTICTLPVCSECVDGEVCHATIPIHTLVRQNIARMREDLRYLTDILTPRYESVRKNIDLVIEAQTGKINTVQYRYVLARNLNFHAFPSEFPSEYRGARCYRAMLRGLEKDLSTFGIKLPRKLLNIILSVETRVNVIKKMSCGLSDMLKDYEILQSPRIYKSKNHVFAKLENVDFFKSIQSSLEISQEEGEIRLCTIESKHKYPKVLPQMKKKTTTKMNKTEQEDSIGDLYNDCSHFVVGGNGPVYVVTILVFAHSGKSRMHGVTFQDCHGEVVFDGVTEVVTQKSPLHCALTMTAKDRYLLAASNVLIEVNLADKPIKTLLRNVDWTYIDIKRTCSNVLLVIQERIEPESHRLEYRLTQCDLNGNLLHVIDYDNLSIQHPSQIQARINGAITVIDKGTGAVLALNLSGKIKHRYQGEDTLNMFRFSRSLLHVDRYGNTMFYDKERRMIQVTDGELRGMVQIKMKKGSLMGLCGDIEDRLVCLCNCTNDHEFEIHVFEYLKKGN